MRLIHLLIFGLFLAPPCPAQSTITNGELIITVPTDGWTQTEAPEVMLKTFARIGNLKLLFHAVSLESKLRFYITRVDYSSFPHSTDSILSHQLAAYINGWEEGTHKTNGAPDIETIDQLALFPTTKVQGVLSNGLSFEIKTVFCSDCLYAIQVSGPPASQNEAEQCLASVSFIGKTPLRPSILAEALQSGLPPHQKTIAEIVGRKIILVSTIVIGCCIIFAIIVSATQAHKAVPKARTPPNP